jgi:DNA polymerase-1
MTSFENKKKIVIIDSNSVIHRAYHALPHLTTKRGEAVGAVYGFLLVFLKAINDFQPDFIAAAFDLPAPTFRHKIYKEYKANRPKAPQDLYAQIPLVKEFLEAFGVMIFEKEGFEADDIIGTIAGRAEEMDNKISAIIISGDSDSLQLVDSDTKIYVLRKGVKDAVLCDEKTIIDKFGGLIAKQLLDFKALRGDASDNIPGVKGVGEKTAMRLLLEFNDLENLYDEIEKETDKSKKIKDNLRQILVEFKKSAFLSKELVRIEKNVPLEFKLEKCAFGGYSKEEIIKMLKSFEFHSLIKRIDITDNTGSKEKRADIKQQKLL